MSDDASARLGLPYLAAGQLQKHVTLNEALTRLDALIQTAVVSRTTSDQPTDPAEGALYILPEDATGDAQAPLFPIDVAVARLRAARAAINRPRRSAWVSSVAPAAATT